jgi:hypothetical protein
MSENPTLDTISRARCHGYEGAEKVYLEELLSVIARLC